MYIFIPFLIPEIIHRRRDDSQMGIDNLTLISPVKISVLSQHVVPFARSRTPERENFPSRFFLLIQIFIYQSRYTRNEVVHSKTYEPLKDAIGAQATGVQ